VTAFYIGLQHAQDRIFCRGQFTQIPGAKQLPVFCLSQFSHARNEKADRADLSAKGWIFILGMG
jgi:hypothetical protein